MLAVLSGQHAGTELGSSSLINQGSLLVKRLEADQGVSWKVPLDLQ